MAPFVHFTVCMSNAHARDASTEARATATRARSAEWSSGMCSSLTCRSSPSPPAPGSEGTYESYNLNAGFVSTGLTNARDQNGNSAWYVNVGAGLPGVGANVSAGTWQSQGSMDDYWGGTSSGVSAGPMEYGWSGDGYNVGISAGIGTRGLAVGAQDQLSGRISGGPFDTTSPTIELGTADPLGNYTGTETVPNPHYRP